MEEFKNQKITKEIPKKVLTNRGESVIICFVNAASPSGKATDSDSVIT